MDYIVNSDTTIGLSLLYPSLIAVFSFVSIGFLVSILFKRNDIADVMWGPGIALAALVGIFYNAASLSTIHILLLYLVGIWALRLSVRIGLKNLKKGEDPRYKKWREEWKFFYLRSYLQVFILQGALMLLLASAVILTSTTTWQTLTLPMYLGLATWMIGFIFEVVSDYQLDAFLKNPQNKGKLMRYGLWKYSRHPNYFGEVTLWWGIWLITFAATFSFWTLITPLTITILILFVSGIPMLERQMSKHPEWDEYKRKTSVLVPWFVKK